MQQFLHVCEENIIMVLKLNEKICLFYRELIRECDESFKDFSRFEFKRIFCVSYAEKNIKTRQK